MLCHKCQKPIPFVDKLSFRADCPSCMADAHVCRNCDFFDPSIYNECRETSADRITDKEKANYCEFFIPSTNSEKQTTTSPADEAKRKLAELFRKT